MKKVFIAGTVVGIICFLNHSNNKYERARALREQQWLEFSMQHHCHITRNPTFGNPTTTWQCDGNFEVVR